MTHPDELAHMPQVDGNDRAHTATETDEEQVLNDLYGIADEDGFHREEGTS